MVFRMEIWHLCLLHKSLLPLQRKIQQTFAPPFSNIQVCDPYIFIFPELYGEVSFAMSRLFSFPSEMDAPGPCLCSFACAAFSVAPNPSALVNQHVCYSLSQTPSPALCQSFSCFPARCHFSALYHPTDFYLYHFQAVIFSFFWAHLSPPDQHFEDSSMSGSPFYLP